MSSVIGVEELYYAIMNQDNSSGVNYQTPKKLPHVKEIAVNTNSSVEVDWADNKPAEAVENDGETTVQIQVKDLPLENQSELLGKSYEGGKLVDKVGDSAPYVAIMYRRKKGNGKSRFVKLLKLKFSIPSETSRTAESTKTFQPSSLQGKVVYRDYDGKWRYRADEDDPHYTGEGATWFDSIEVTDDTTAPTVTVEPADGDSDVATSGAIVWTFSEAIVSTLVTAANFIVMKADGTLIAGTLAYDVDNYIVTFTPSAALSAATDYVAICTANITDLAGNTLEAPSVTNFTTA